MTNSSNCLLIPLVALTVVSACEPGSRELDAGDDELRSIFYVSSYANNPQPGTRLNTNNIGDWPFALFRRDRSFHEHIRLVSVETGPFDQRYPWEVDDVPPGLQIDVVNGDLQLDVIPEHMLVGTADYGFYSLQHSDFNNSIWTVEVEPDMIPDLDAEGVQHQNGRVELRLEVTWQTNEMEIDVQFFGEEIDELTAAQQGAIPVYTFWYEINGETVSTCDSKHITNHVGMGAVFYRDLEIDTGSGMVTNLENSIYIACTKGASGKAAANYGFWPDQLDPQAIGNGDHRPEFETTLRMIRADYCGDGVSWTVPGTPIEVFDVYPTTSFESALPMVPAGSVVPTVEAVWDIGGAVCVDDPRIQGNYPSYCGLSACGGNANAFSLLQGARLLTRNRRP